MFRSMKEPFRLTTRLQFYWNEPLASLSRSNYLSENRLGEPLSFLLSLLEAIPV